MSAEYFDSTAALLLGCLAPLALATYLLYCLRDRNEDQASGELLIEELTTDRPLLLPSPSSELADKRAGWPQSVITQRGARCHSKEGIVERAGRHEPLLVLHYEAHHGRARFDPSKSSRATAPPFPDSAETLAAESTTPPSNLAPDV